MSEIKTCQVCGVVSAPWSYCENCAPAMHGVDVAKKKSTHRVDVVPVVLERHPNADKLSIVRVYGYSCVVQTADWNDGDLAAYVVPDSVVDTQRPEFAFLGDHSRVKVKKLRGVVSQGLLVPAPAGSKIGDDVAEQLGVKRYEPPLPMSTFGERGKSPAGTHYCYDVDSWRRYRHVFVDGEDVVVTEKLHGASGRFVWQDGVMYCGSRTEWKKEDDKNLWWQALKQNPAIGEFCKSNPGLTLYGEVYGQVQDLKYGAGKGRIFFAAFDVLRTGEWLAVDEAKALAVRSDVPWVPIIYRGPYDAALVEGMADGKSLAAPGGEQIREGCVVKTTVERIDLEIGRCQLKIISNEYLGR